MNFFVSSMQLIFFHFQKENKAKMFMNWIVNYIRNQFPEAPAIGTDEAKEAIENMDKNVFVVDCRRPDEFDVSKISGSVSRVVDL